MRVTYKVGKGNIVLSVGNIQDCFLIRDFL